MTTSLITLVANRASHLAHLVAGVARGDERPDELVVVDMGSKDAPRDVVDAVDLDVNVVWVTPDELAAPSRPGLPLAAARNVGASRATGDQLVFCDVDCIPSRTLVGAYRRAIGRGGLCCGPVRYLERFWHRHDAPHPVVDDEVLRARSAPHPARPAPSHEHVDERHELFWSLSFGLDRATWERVGGFDESYVGYGGEDTDFGFRARAAGVDVRWMDDGLAFHQWHPVSDPPVEHLDDIVANARSFRRRWGTWPMEGWLQGFADRGLVTWSPTADDVAPPPPGADVTRPRRLTVLSIPATHPYTRRVVPPEVDVVEDPTDPWWPHPGLDPVWVEAAHDRFDVVHLHFGFEHRSTEQLAHWCDALDRLDLDLVLTVHDLRNPHLRNNDDHDAHLATLVARAAEVLTLTEAAAVEITARWGRRPLVVPHPHLAPLDLPPLDPVPPDLVPPRPPGTAKDLLRIGVDFKHFRANTLAPEGLLEGLAAGAEEVGAVVEVRAGDDGDERARRRLLHVAATLDLDVTVGPRPGDASLFDRLARLDVSVLPYGFGSHSGWLELCRDVGTRVLAPRTGFYADQWGDVETFALTCRSAADPDSVRAAVVAAFGRPRPDPADPGWRAAQLESVHAAHLALYRRLARAPR